MKISLEEAGQLARDVLDHIGFSVDAANTIAKHLLDSQLRGYGPAGLPRLLAIRDRLDGRPPQEHIEVVHETPVIAQLDGHDTFGYLVGQRAVDLAMAKAKISGLAMVSANNTWTTGMLAYYAEAAARANLVTIITANSTPWVAAHGGHRGVHGTNPICIGFPSGLPDQEPPIILDMATSSILHADIVLAQRLGTSLPKGSAFDPDGNPTTDPFRVLDGGAMAPWGGYKGSGLASMVQLFGILAGSPAFPPPLAKFGMSILAIDPAQFQPLADYQREITVYRQGIRASAGTEGDPPVRLPFERSAKQREEAIRDGYTEIDETILATLRGMVKGRGPEKEGV